MANRAYSVPIEIVPSSGGGGGSGTVTSVGTAGIATGGPITTTGTVTVAGSGNTTTAATAAANLAAAASGNVVSTDGSGNVQSSGTLLSSLAPLASPTFTGTPAAPTATTGTSTTQLATTAFVHAVANAGVTSFSGDGTVLSNSASTGAVTATLVNATANMVLAGPVTGAAAAPTFRSLVAADILSGIVTWDKLGNANGNLSLSNASNTTTFNQTSNVNWVWANTTTATSGTTNSSPIVTLKQNYWTGAASAVDTWTFGSGVAAGTNAVSILQVGHIAGSTGNAYFSLASTIQGLQLLNNPAALDFGTNTSWTLNFTDSSGANTDGSLVFTSGTSLNLQTGAATQLVLTGAVTTANAAGVRITNANNFTGTVTQNICQMSGTFAPTSGSGTMIGNRVSQTINQTSSASGNYQVQVLQAVETALLGSANKFLVCEGGVAGTTVKYEINSAGVVDTYNGIATVSNGIPGEIATVDLTAQSAAIAATTIYAVPAGQGGMYRISWNADITTAGTSSVLGGAGGYQVLYTSPTDSVVKTTVSGNSVTSAANTTGTAVSGVMIVYAKASTNIQHQFGYTSTGTTMVFQLHAKVEQL